MRIISPGMPQNPKMRGICETCYCEIECQESETKTLRDRDTQPGMATQYVKCPNCGDDFLWVKEVE